jgi:propionyl-CoA synthetase
VDEQEQADDMATESYRQVYQDSIRSRDDFWLDAARLIDWERAPRSGWTEGQGWFADGMLNTSFNAVDRHVIAGKGEAPAVIYESPITGTRQTFTYRELLDQVSRTAGMLARLGVVAGDRVVIYMPMIPHTMFAMLACARLGAVHSVVFGGFAAAELAKRIDDARPRLVLTASCGLEPGRIVAYKPLVDQALELAKHQVEHVILFQREQLSADMRPGRDLDWSEALAQSEPTGCTMMRATDPLYILYTSGTTGTPKGVVRQIGGQAVALAWSMRNLYGIQPGEVFWAASDMGWAVGHSYIVYGPLLTGATTILFEGKPVGTPDAGTFWRIIEANRVAVFFTAPTSIRAVRKEDPHGKQITGTGGLRALFLAGERADPDTVKWAEEHLHVPVIDHWWQTELGWPALATCLGLGDDRRRLGSAGFPVPGYAFRVIDDSGADVATGETGNIVIEAPLPPGAFTTLWNNPQGYARCFASWPGCYETGDAGFIDDDGFVHIMGRTDDIINVAGHRLSTGQMEQIIAAHPAVAECAVIGANDDLKGMVPLAFAVTKSGYDSDGDTAREIVNAVRNELGPVAALKHVFLVEALPKTRSGKILRATLRTIANGEALTMPASIENPDALVRMQALFGR